MSDVVTIRELALEQARAMLDGDEPRVLAPALIGRAHELDEWVRQWDTQFASPSRTISHEEFAALEKHEREAWEVLDGVLRGTAEEAARLLEVTAFDDPVFLLRRAEERDSRPGITIGRGKRNDVAIGHPTLSTLHARVDIDGEACSMTDLSSRNGTWINDVKLEPNIATPVRTADAVRFGNASFLFLLPDSLRMFLKLHLLRQLRESQ